MGMAGGAGVGVSIGRGGEGVGRNGCVNTVLSGVDGQCV